MWITYDQLIDLSDSLDRERRKLPWYRFLSRYSLSQQVGLLDILIHQLERLAIDEQEAHPKNCTCSYGSDGTEILN